MPRCHISLGGNSGPVAETFEIALRRLQDSGDCRVVAVSSHIETTPVGDEAGVVFLNAAAELETVLAPLELLDQLQCVERELGRTRTTHWGPRTLDLDLLFYESQIIESARLVVPHPAAWYRRFVLDPLVEIAPRLVHPVKDVEIAVLRDRLLARPLRISLAGGTSAEKTALIGSLSPMFPAVAFSDWNTYPHGEPEPALIFWLGPEPGFSEPGCFPPAGCDFDSLPRLPRIDATAGVPPVQDFVRYVIQSAQG